LLIDDFYFGMAIKKSVTLNTSVLALLFYSFSLVVYRNVINRLY